MDAGGGDGVPYVYFVQGISFSKTVLVTESGAELLTRMERKLYIR